MAADSWQPRPASVPATVGYVSVTINTAGAIAGRHEVLLTLRSTADGATSAFARIVVDLTAVRMRMRRPLLQAFNHAFSCALIDFSLVCRSLRSTRAASGCLLPARAAGRAWRR